MRLTSRVLKRRASVEALPQPFVALRRRVHFYPGQTSLTVAAPTVGKSQFWANYAHRSGVPTMYWSADTDQHDQRLRAIALWSGMTVEDIEEKIRDEAWYELLEEHLQRGNHIEWIFDANIDERRLEERLFAFAEIYGRFPGLVVADNLSNAIGDFEKMGSEGATVLATIQKLARLSGTHIAILAHSKGYFEDGNKPIPLSGSLQNLFKIPEVGLTLHRPDENTLGINVVKARHAKGDPLAKNAILLPVDYSRATVKGFANVA